MHSAEKSRCVWPWPDELIPFINISIHRTPSLSVTNTLINLADQIGTDTHKRTNILQEIVLADCHSDKVVK